MKRIWFTIAAFVVACCGTVLLGADLRAGCESPPKFHTEWVSSDHHTYTISMGGRLDGEMTRDPVGYWAYDQFWEPNIYVRLENVGDVPVINPWLRRTDRPDTRTVKSIVDFVIRPDMSDAEKARRLWEFEIRNRFHATTDDTEVDDVVKRFNCYGYTLCGNESKIMSDLWRAAGLKVRKGYPNGHSTAEVFYDKAWHLLDSDESIICLLPDNKTIASEEQIVADHWLMKRTHTYGPLHNDDPMRDETSAALHYYEGKREGEQPSLTKHNMDFMLRPGEAITWAWNPGNRFHGKEYEGSESNLWNKRWRLIAHVMDGELSYAADLTREATLKYLTIENVQLRPNGPFGRALYLAGAQQGSLILPVKTPYPVVGGRLEVDFGRRDSREHVNVLISFDQGKNWKEVWTNAEGDYARMYIDLNEFFPTASPARYEYWLKVELTSAAAEPAVCLKGIYLRSTLQMARLALPGLSLGRNEFVYTDQSGPGRKVKITHAWTECEAAVVPGQPQRALNPPDGGNAAGTRITFRWAPPSEGAPAVDYEFQLSEYADMRYELSPNFRKLISRTANRGTASYQLPYAGLLNPAQTYYWRVRARSAEGVWGPWSRVFSFSAEAPAVPVNVVARVDRQSRTVSLSWQPGSNGSKPVRYRIYGSAERGFTPHDEPYVYNAGVDGMKHSPPNLLLETQTAVTSVMLPKELWRAYYRVVALDTEGRDSGPSALAELSHPLIRTETLPKAEVSTYYQAQIDVSASIGHLVSADFNGRPYHMKFRNGDELAFEMTGAPRGLTIGRNTGLIAGFVPADAAGNYELVIKVTDQRTGAQDSVKLPLGVGTKSQGAKVRQRR